MSQCVGKCHWTVLLNFLFPLYFFHRLIIWKILIESVILVIYRNMLDFFIILLEGSWAPFRTFVFRVRLWSLYKGVWSNILLIRRHHISTKINFVSYTFTLFLLANFIYWVNLRIIRFMVWVTQLLRALHPWNMFIFLLLIHYQLKFWCSLRSRILLKNFITLFLFLDRFIGKFWRVWKRPDLKRLLNYIVNILTLYLFWNPSVCFWERLWHTLLRGFSHCRRHINEVLAWVFL